MTDFLRNALIDLRTFNSLFDTNWENVTFDYPYNLSIKEDGTNGLEYALAGFLKNEIEVILENNTLTIAAKKQRNDDDSTKTLHKGIAERSLKAIWRLTDRGSPEKMSVSFNNGLLRIEIPQSEETKPITIPIN